MDGPGWVAPREPIDEEYPLTLRAASIFRAIEQPIVSLDDARVGRAA